MLATALMASLAACAPTPERPPEISDLFSTEQQAAARADCLKARGWDVDLTDGVITAEVPEEQSSVYERDSEECLVEAGVDTDAPLTQEQLRAVFVWYSDISQCLQDYGYSVPPRPSEQAFMESYGTDPWIPWSELNGLQLSQATEKCPVMQRP